MRKLFNFFAAALVMLAAASCEKNEALPDNNSEGKIVTLKASINNGGTKTSLGQGMWEEGDPKVYPVLWSEGDAIAVIQTINEETKIFKFVLQGQGKTAEGEFRLDVYDGCDYTLEENAFNASAGIQAFYPFEGISLNDDGSINYTVPATQTYTTTVVNEVVCSTFGNGVSPMAAYADNAAVGLSFENLFGVLKLQLKGAENEKVFGIEIISDKSLKGNAQLTIGDASNSISLTSTESSDKKVILKCKEGVSLSPDTPADFLVALPANATNLKVLIHTNVGSYTKDIPVSDKNSIKAGQILLMPVLTLGEEDEDVNPIIYMENGERLGNGIAIPNSDGTFTIWAPVNCGYHPTDYPYGKMYQWGRKDGQGYFPFGNNNGKKDPGITEAKFSGDPLPGTLDADTFYGNWWANEWNEENNPCPAGWRLPTNDDVKGLKEHYSDWVINGNLQGRWLCGGNEYQNGMSNAIFLHAAGALYKNYGIAECNGQGMFRGTTGFYYTSPYYDNDIIYMKVTSSGVSLVRAYKNSTNGYSVRCVKDMSQSQPMPGSN